MVKVTAHRGFSGRYAENTVLSVKKAVRLGVDQVEVDVWLSLDHKVVVIHDKALKRLTGRKGRITRMTYDQMRGLHLKDGEHRIPLLENIFPLTKKSTILNIEVKSVWAAKPVADLVKKHKMQNKVIVSSRSILALKVIKNELPGVKTAFIFFASSSWKRGIFVTSIAKMFFRLVQHYVLFLAKAVKTNHLNISYPFATTAFIKRAQKHGYEVNVWTVNTKALMKKLIKRKANGIITNYPDKLKKVIKELEK